MPITPLHFGVMAPINHFFPGKVSSLAFVLVTCWLDAGAITYALFGVGSYDHGPDHSFLGGLAISLVVAVIRPVNLPWILGALIGGFTHVLLDAAVHVDVNPFYPWGGNALRIASHEGLSAVLIPFLVWFTFQSVSSIRDWIERPLEH